jgi:hypothetical protein
MAKYRQPPLTRCYRAEATPDTFSLRMRSHVFRHVTNTIEMLAVHGASYMILHIYIDIDTAGATRSSIHTTVNKHVL